jgi:hypothetical protein
VASEIVVERQFRFHCSCGVTIASGERTVTCARCGAKLGVRRVRRHRQNSESVAYYGTRAPVRRIERHASRLGAWLKNLLSYGAEAIKVRRAVKHVPLTSRVLDLAVQAEVHPILDAVAPPAGNESPRRAWFGRAWFEGAHVKVGPTRPDGTPHPHGGATGRIAKFTNAYSEPYWQGLPSAMIKLDSEIRPQGFIWVSLECLEVLPEDPPTARS